MRAENHNYSMAGALVEGLAGAGLRHVVMCPGSRSGPLAVSFARCDAIKTWVHLDERSAGFFALGIAKGSRGVMAVLTTSGTAAANLLPAVVEARLTGVPLVVITADRPRELIDWGANQTIEQSGIYGGHVKWSADMPVPEDGAALVNYASAVGRRAYVMAMGYPSGPVHLNMPFREPLAPIPVSGEETEMSRGTGVLDDVVPAATPCGLAVGRDMGSRVKDVERGLIVCGPQDKPGLAKAVGEVGVKLGYPILADPLSQVRFGKHNRSHVVDFYDLILRDEGLWGRLEPELVIRFGAWPTSKLLGAFMARAKGARHVLVTESGWADPSHLAADVVQVDPVSFCRGVMSEGGEARAQNGWVKRWVEMSLMVREGMEDYMSVVEDMFEGKVFLELQKHLMENSILFVGNSMPVRDMDTFMASSGKSIRVMGNRGASGIDGVVSTALGSGVGAETQVVAVVGDISFFHDMTGLLMTKHPEINVTIIVLNNDGGGIFSFLPQAQYAEHFEEVYGTPHGLSFESAARLYGLGYVRVGDWEEFGDAVGRSLSSAGTSIVEVPGSRERNLALHREAWAAASEAMKSNKRIR